MNALPTTLSRRGGFRATAVIGTAVLVAAALALPTSASASVAVPTVDKVTICHATNSNSHPYSEITPDVDSIVKKSGHDSHDGPVWNPTLKANHTTWGDIIPAFDYDKGNAVGHYDGKNVPGGQALLAAHCMGLGSGELEIKKSGPSTATQGTNGTYTLTIYNSGESSITGDITVTDTVPTGWAIVSATGAGGLSCAVPVGQVITCTATSDLAPVTAAASTMKVTVVVTYTTAGSKTNQASVAAADDDDTTNDTAYKTTNVTAAPAADLEVAKAGPDTAVAGTIGTYTLTTTNSGTSPVTGDLSIVDTVPTGWLIGTVTPPAGVTCTTVLQVISCSTAADLAVDGTIVITVSVTYDAGSTGTNRVTVGASDDTDASNNTASKTTTVTDAPAPDLRVAKSGPTTATTGSTGSYSLTVYNTGTGDITAPITVVDTVPFGWTVGTVTTPAGFSCLPVVAQVVSCTTNQDLPPVTAGDSAMVLTIEVSYDFSGTRTNGVTVSATDDANMQNNNATVDTTVSDPLPSANVTKSNNANGDDAFGIDETASSVAAAVPFKLHIQNTSPFPVAVTSVTDAVDESAGTPVTCSPALTLDIGQAGDCTFTMTGYSPADGGVKSNIATVELTRVFPQQIDSAALHRLHTAALVGVGSIRSNASLVRTHVPVVPVVPNVPVVPPPPAPVNNLGVSKTGPGSAQPGDELVYEIDVTNVSGTPATGFTVTDVVPVGLAISSVSGSGFACSVAGQTITCTYTGTLAVGDKASIGVRALLDAAFTGTSIANTAVVDPGRSDSDASDNSSTATTTVTPLPVAGETGGPAEAPAPPAAPAPAPVPVAGGDDGGGALPFTGLPSLGLLQAGVGMLLMGLLVALLARRRRLTDS